MGPPVPSRRSSDLLFGGHLVLALAMVGWRAFEALPGWSAADGGSFTSSGAGRLAALATLIACVFAGLAVVRQSFRRWREPAVALLGLTFALALSTRSRADLFDLVYVGLASACAVWWFRSERDGAQASA